MTEITAGWKDEIFKYNMAIQNRRKWLLEIAITLTIAFALWTLSGWFGVMSPVARFFPVSFLGFISVILAWLYLRFDGVLVMYWQEDGQFVPHRIFSHRELMRRDPEDDYRSPFWRLLESNKRYMIVPFPGSRGKSHIVVGGECKKPIHFLKGDLLENHTWSIRLSVPTVHDPSPLFRAEGPNNSRAEVDEPALHTLLSAMYGNERGVNWGRLSYMGFMTLSDCIKHDMEMTEAVQTAENFRETNLKEIAGLQDGLRDANARLKTTSENRGYILIGLTVAIRQIMDSTRLRRTKEGTAVLNTLLTILRENASPEDMIPADITVLIPTNPPADETRPHDPTEGISTETPA